ncbi:MAG: T9SS type A sorting domain-containing protein [candidate division WOR-3 bacterium]
MKKLLLLILIITPFILWAQVDVDSIYLWDNDRGKSMQYFPVVGARNWGAFIGWQDSRWNDYDIYRQQVRWSGSMIGGNTMVSIDSFCQYQQIYPDLEGNPSNQCVFVWEDSMYQPGNQRPTEIKARIYNNIPFTVYSGSRSQKRPSVSCKNDGQFVISFTNYDPGNYPRIDWRLYDANGSLLNSGIAKLIDSLRHHIPISRVAFCDSGFVVVYDDSSGDGSQRSVYLQYRNRNGDLIAERIRVSNTGGNEDYPAVSVNQYGFGAIVWQYWYGAADIDIYCRTFQMRPGTNNITLSPEIAITTTTNNSRFPRVTVFPNNDYFIVWDEFRSVGTGFDIMGRAWIGSSLKPEFTINQDTLNQGYPDVECKNTDSCIVAWVSQERLTIMGKNYFDIFCRAYFKTNDNMIPLGDTIRITPYDTIGGRKGWYFDDENYDNPLTSDWNEDPIDEPDSIFLDLDSAIVDQIMELNTNGQYRIFNEDTLAGRQKSRDLLNYDAVFVNLGYRTDEASAGVINTTEQATLVDYINSRQPTMIEGSDFGEMYNGTALFNKYGANYLGPGASYIQGNIDTLYGVTGTSFADETLKFNYKTLVDNYPDSISAKSGYELILRGSGATDRWATGRAVGSGTYWKEHSEPIQDSFKVYATFPLSGIRGTVHPHTYAEFYRRLLGYLGLHCQPEPITTLTATTGSSEGRVTMTWRVVSDDKPNESAEGNYKLKFSRTKITSETAFNDSTETYYQTWNTASQPVKTLITQNLIGLPPMDTLVFALKVSDEESLWSALGAEPRAVVAGDSVTPHTIIFGTNYVKDFSNKYEFIDRRRKNDTGTDFDSLFVTWNYPNSPALFEFGFARCNFNTEGDLFIYVDTKSGGADSTVPYNGTTGRSGFFKTAVDSFRPDYCLIIENANIRRYRKWVATKDGRGSWVSVDSGGTVVVEDNVVNNFMYTEGYIRYDTMSYTAGNSFKLVVLMTEETTNNIINAFPISNPLGTYKNIVQYYSWGSDGLTSGKVPARRQLIGIEEEMNPKSKILNSRLLAFPNPFYKKTKIFLPAKYVATQDISLKIYDVSGRLVKEFSNLIIKESDYVVWDGLDNNNDLLPPGIYFCRFAIRDKDEIIKIIYLK